MDTLSALLAPHSKLGDTITAVDLPHVLKNFPEIKLLSLDCFDTLIWRKTATAIDVFYDLQKRLQFQALGFTALMRVRAETNARMLKIFKTGSNEVQLQDIYRAAFPSLGETEIELLEADELATEIDYCYALPHTIELIRTAIATGLKIVIVSDTYLKQQQLQYLLKHTLPTDVVNALDVIICSNEYNRSKTNGLFQDVLKKFSVNATDILHIGDNVVADFAAPRALKINALHLRHHHEGVEDILRMHDMAASFMDARIRDKRPLHNPFKGVFASTTVPIEKPEQIIGYLGLGPLLFAFAKFLQSEIDDLKNAGKKPKVVFLMRDAYLPARVCEELAGHTFGKNLCISRFATYAATFRTEEDIDRYLMTVINSNRFADIAKQLLLPDSVIDIIVSQTLKATVPGYEFRQLIHQPHILEMIFSGSAAYRERLLRYIKNTAELTAGDTLVFVDLGYSGTTQNQLETLLKKEFEIDVTGRYLISIEVPHWKTSRRGLMDPNWCDGRTMHMLIAYIALLEQLCTSNDNSVIDYDQHGNPIYGKQQLSHQQHTHLDAIQTETLRFAKEANTFFALANTELSQDALQDYALAALTRLLFLPSNLEIQHFEKFQFDLNLATDATYSLMDREKGLQGLRQRGIFSLFMEQNGKTLRTNTPAELRAEGLQLSFALMARHRFSLDILQKDISLRKERLHVIAMLGKESNQAILDAPMTHDGYFTLWVPMGTGNFNVGILFGKNYHWVQIESAQLIAANVFMTQLETQETQDAWSTLIFEKMVEKGSEKRGNLYECVTDTSFVLIKALDKPSKTNQIMRIVFRPIVSRS